MTTAAPFNECLHCSADIPMDADLCASCEENAAERAGERAYEDFHGGRGPLPLDEQCRRAAELKR